MKNTSNIESHRKYLKAKFRIKLGDQPYLTVEEREILEKHGAWMKALVRGLIVPLTKAQQRFIDVARGTIDASSPHEQAWMHLQSRKNLRIAADELLREKFRNRRLAKAEAERIAQKEKKAKEEAQFRELAEEIPYTKRTYKKDGKTFVCDDLKVRSLPLEVGHRRFNGSRHKKMG